MNIIPKPAPVHPAWCDLTECAQLDDLNVVHRSAPLRIRGGDVAISVGLGRFDGLGQLGFIGPDTVRLRMVDLLRIGEIATGLDSAQARQLADTLQGAATLAGRPDLLVAGVHDRAPLRGGDVEVEVSVGPDGVRLHLHDLESTALDGADVDGAAYLDDGQARLLAAFLRLAADQLDDAVAR